VREHTFVLSTNQKGAIAETKIAAAATELDVPVLRPIVDHARYDLAFEIGGRLVRVQCKWGNLGDGGAVLRVNLTSSWCTPTGYERRYYGENEIDLVAVYCHELDRCYLLPSKLVAGRRCIDLRLKPPKNRQRACLNLAVDFELPGAIAQLGERLHGMQEVAGSSPASSTPSTVGALHVGANQFRTHFGYYLEKAAEGHEVLVSRRGRPCVWLTSAEPSLQLAAA
jgi:prevent-host-death family protein